MALEVCIKKGVASLMQPHLAIISRVCNESNYVPNIRMISSYPERAGDVKGETRRW